MKSQYILEKDAELPDLKELGFGKWASPYMYVRRYRNGAWEAPIIHEYDLFALDPAAQALHYGQLIFEGMKAYYNKDLGKIFTFRPEENAKRYQRSAQRLVMPELPVPDFLASVFEAVRLARRWIPPFSEANPIEASLYIRPFLMGTSPKLGVKPSDDYAHAVITSPSGPYFRSGFTPIRLKVETEYVRAVRGGTGEAKCAGNYASSLLAAKRAEAEGFSQVLWLDGVDRRYIEEVGAMNVFVLMNGTLMTPSLTGSILPGITRSSILTMGEALGVPVAETNIDIHELLAGIENGTVTEMFGSGTAAVVTPVGLLGYQGKEYAINGGHVGELTSTIYKTLVRIQYGLEQPAYAKDWCIEIKDA